MQRSSLSMPNSRRGQGLSERVEGNQMPEAWSAWPLHARQKRSILLRLLTECDNVSDRL